MGRENTLPAEMMPLLKEAWDETPTYSHVAKRCGISRPTAKKYLDFGDPERGIAPVRADAMIANIERQERVTTVEYTNADVQAAGLRQLAKLDRLIGLAAAALEAELLRPKKRPPRVRLTDISKAMQIRLQLASAYGSLTERTSTTTTSTSVDIFRDKSPDELGYYADHGAWPDEIELQRYEAERRAALPESHLPPSDPRDEQWPKE